MNTPYVPTGLVSALQRRLTRLRARKLVNCAHGRRVVSFSFDDFPRSAAKTGAEIVEKFGWRATYYTSAGFENTSNHMGALFTATDVAKLVAKGHEIGCHTENHIDCSLNAPVVLAREIRRNQMRLRAFGAPTPRSFAYPFGEASPKNKTLLGQYYACSRGVHAGINRRNADAHQLRAVPIEGHIEDKHIPLSYLDSLAKDPGWLIFYMHDIDPTPGQWGCTPKLLETICEATQAAGFEVLTITDAFAQLSPSEKAA